MWSLIEHDTSAHGQFVAHARPVHELVVVPGVDHAELAQLAVFDDFANLSNRRIEAMRVTAEQFDAVLFRRFVHGVAFGQSHRHGFFNDDVFTVFRRRNRMLGVKRVGRGDVDCIHVGAAAQIFDGLVALAVVGLAKFRDGVGSRIRRRRDLDKRQLGQRRQNLRAGDTEPGDTHTKNLRQILALASASRDLAYSFQSSSLRIMSEITKKCGKRLSAVLRMTCGGSFPACTSLIARSIIFRAETMTLSEETRCSSLRSWMAPWLAVAKASCA